jgi:hypothetical protein
MHIYLNPPRVFWGIEDTDIQLTRGKPFYEIEQDELDDLDAEQKETLRLSLLANVVTKINKDWIPKNSATMGVEYILTKRASEIQRKYVSRMLLAKDVKSLKELAEAEKKRKRPRKAVLGMVKYALGVIEDEKGTDYTKYIRSVDDDLGGQVELDLDDAVEIKPKKKDEAPLQRRRKPRNRASKLTEE